MAVITFRTLKSELASALECGKVPEKNVREISSQLKAENKRSFTVVVVLVSVFAVLAAAFLIYMFVLDEVMREQMLTWIIGTVVLLAAIFGLCYLAFVGLIKRQFNSALKSGYPNLYDECKI